MMNRFAAFCFCSMLGACASTPPACGDKEIIQIVRSLLTDNAGQVLASFAPKDDLATGFVLMALLQAAINGKDESAQIHWTLDAPRTTALDEKLVARGCAVDVAYGNKDKVLGRFSLPYRVSLTDDKRAYVVLGN